MHATKQCCWPWCDDCCSENALHGETKQTLILNMFIKHLLITLLSKLSISISKCWQLSQKHCRKNHYPCKIFKSVKMQLHWDTAHFHSFTSFFFKFVLSFFEFAGKLFCECLCIINNASKVHKLAQNVLTFFQFAWKQSHPKSVEWLCFSVY